MKILTLTFWFLFNSNCLINSNVLNNLKSTKEIIGDYEDKKIPPPPHSVHHKQITLDDIENLKLNTKKPSFKTNLLYCSNNKYFPIERIKITENDFNCHDKNIEIHFEYHDKDLQVKKGYLTNDTEGTQCIKEHQENSIKCKKIRRYNINNDKVLIVIDKNFQVISKEKADEFVLNTLKNAFQTYFTYVMLKWFDAYDEADDSYRYFDLYKNISTVVTSFLLLFLIGPFFFSMLKRNFSSLYEKQTFVVDNIPNVSCDHYKDFLKIVGDITEFQKAIEEKNKDKKKKC